MSWHIQRQWRDHKDLLTSFSNEHVVYNDERIAAFIMQCITDGWRIVDQDKISVTLRWDGPAGLYQFIHCWREGST